MNDFLAAGLSAAAIFGVVVLLIRLQLILMRWIDRKYTAAEIWDDAYQQGVEDERKAIEWDVPKYPTAARSNPYRKKN